MFFLLLLLNLFLIDSVYAFEILDSAHQIPEKGVVFSLFGVSGNKDINLTLEKNTRIFIGTHSFFSTSKINLNSVLSDTRMTLKATTNVFEKLYLYGKGSFGVSALEIPGSSGSSKFSGASTWSLGIGAKRLILPDTIVTPSVALDFGYEFYKAGLSKVETSIGTTDVNAVFISQVYQFSMIVGKRLKSFEPYGALKIMRTLSEIKDENTSATISGTKDDAGLTFGLKWNAKSKLSPAIELSFLGEKYFSAGVVLNF